MNNLAKEAKNITMLQFGMNPMANWIVFHFTKPYRGQLMHLFDRGMMNENFDQNVVEFLANVSMTHMIVSVDYINYNRFDIWLRESFDTNIDEDLIDSVLKNISGK